MRPTTRYQVETVLNCRSKPRKRVLGRSVHHSRPADELALRKILKGLSCRDYEACVEPLAETFGLSGSSLSRRYKRTSARKLAELQERDLSKHDLVAFGLPPWSPSLLDGKTFGDDAMVIALGLTISGEKVVLGFVQTATENEKACAEFLRGLLERGLKVAEGLLDEGLEETLTLHRLGLFKELGRSFKTTNCLENLNALLGQRTDKVDYWRNADQKHRWLATALLDIEPRLRKVAGYQHLPKLRAALQAATAPPKEALRGAKTKVA